MLQVLGRLPEALAVKILLGYIPVNMEVSRDIARIAKTATVASTDDGAFSISFKELSGSFTRETPKRRFL
jgi:hypothetical protein